MSQQCHICGPVKHECPTVICAPCGLNMGNAMGVRLAALKKSAEDRCEAAEEDLFRT